MNHIKAFLSVISAFLSLVSFAQQNGPGELYAGFAKGDITPGKQVNLYGYDPRLSAGIHDRLMARVTVFRNNDRKFVLISTDVGAYKEVTPVFRKSLMDKFDLEDSELFLTAIHSHSSPVLTLDKEKGNPNNVGYTELLITNLLDLTAKAFNNLQPVRTGVGVGYLPIGINRRKMTPEGSINFGRNANGITDKEVLVMKVTRPDGNALGAIYDYAVHATSLGQRSLLVSGDVLGISAQFVEKILGNNVVSPVFAGASGNIDPWNRVLPGFNEEPGWIPEPVLLGTFLGEEVVNTFRSITELKTGGEIKTSCATVECPRKSTDKLPKEGQSKTVPVNIIAACIDDAVFVGFNVEMITEVGLRIKAASPFAHTFIITHCNGYSGYLPPPEMYKEGGYEIKTSPFEIGSSDMVVKKTLEMLYDLK